MRILKRNVIFWGKNVLVSFGCSLAGTLILFLFIWMGNAGEQNFLVFAAQLFPYYLFLVGFFVNALLGVSNVRTYFRMLLSMGATRKETTMGLLGSLAASNLSIMVFAWLIWQLVPGELSAAGLQIFALLSGILFVTAGLMAVCGAGFLRWGKVGAVVAGICGMMLGGSWGFLLSYSINEGMREFFLIRTADISQGICRTVLAVGLGIFLLGGLFAVYALRKTEVR